ncbi:unnamed protein product [Agarophyton chilense]
MDRTPNPRKSQAPRSGFGSNNARPLKRHRPWSETVERFALANGVETDEHRLFQRQKQIAYGKNTLAYDRFIAACPREKRKKGDPMTPLIRQKCSKRSFMGQVTSWKKKIYAFVAELDPEAAVDADATADATVDAKVDVTADGCLLDGDDFRLNGGVGTRKVSGLGARSVSGENVSYAASTGRSTEAVTDDEEVDLSDLDDIELDDQGNVITRDDATHSREPERPVDKSKESGPSIFTPYDI